MLWTEFCHGSNLHEIEIESRSFIYIWMFLVMLDQVKGVMEIVNNKMCGTMKDFDHFFTLKSAI